jgi:cell division protein FtsL
MNYLLQKSHSQFFFASSSFFWLVFFWLSVMASSLAVIYVAYDNRVKFNQLENLRREQSHLQVVWGQYLLEESTWAAYERVERIAREQLSMQVPRSEQMVEITSDLGTQSNKGE